MLRRKVIVEELEDVEEAAGYLWKKGWAERNGGNISLDLTGELDEIPLPATWEEDTPKACPSLSGRILYITGTGKRMRDVAGSPLDHGVLMRIGEAGKSLFVTVASQAEIHPTSELPTHLAIHEFLREHKSECRCVVHTHPTELIAMTHLPEFADEDRLNRTLWSMIPETAIFVPDGAGVVPYALPGSQELAEKTIDKLRSHSVVLWEKHGCLAVGRTANEAFDLIDTLNKSAQIYFVCRNSGVEPQGLSDEQVKELWKTYVPGKK